MTRYRRDSKFDHNNGATAHYSVWIGGPTLAAVTNCPWNVHGEPRVTAEITGEPDTYFSIPAVIRVRGSRVRGYITNDGQGPVFHHCYY